MEHWSNERLLLRAFSNSGSLATTVVCPPPHSAVTKCQVRLSRRFLHRSTVESHLEVMLPHDLHLQGAIRAFTFPMRDMWHDGEVIINAIGIGVWLVRVFRRRSLNVDTKIAIRV